MLFYRNLLPQNCIYLISYLPWIFTHQYILLSKGVEPSILAVCGLKPHAYTISATIANFRLTHTPEGIYFKEVSNMFNYHGRSFSIPCGILIKSLPLLLVAVEVGVEAAELLDS